MPLPHDRFGAALPLAVCLLCMAALAPLLGAPLLFDDDSVVAKDPFVAAVCSGDSDDGSPFHDLWHRPRPVRILTHRIDAKVFGPSLVGPHAENIALHIGVGLLFAALLRAIGVPDGTRLAAMALFLLHPVCVESVGILSHRKEILSALFLLAALHLSLSSRPAIRAAAFPLLFLATFSKETAVVFPALWLLADSERSRRAGKPFRPDGPRLRAFALWALLSGALAALAWLQIRHGMAVLGAAPALDPDRAGHFGGGAPWGLAVSAALRALPRHLAGLLVPWGHSIDPAFDLDVPLASPRTLGAAAFWIAVVAALFRLLRRRSGLFAPLAWTVIALSPYLFPPFLRSGGTAAYCDRYAYLAAAGFAWILAEGLHAAAARAGLLGRRAAAPAAAVAAVFAGCTLAEALDFRSEAAFWGRASRWNPRSPQSRYNLAYALWTEEGKARDAQAEFERMRALAPGFAFGMAGYADFLASQRKDDAALEILEQGLRSRPGNPILLRKKPAILLHAGRYTSALKACRAAKAAGIGSFQFVFAEACRNNLLWPEAYRRYRRAAAADPSYREAARRNAILVADPADADKARGLLVLGDSVPHGTDALGAGRPGTPLAQRVAARLGDLPFRDDSEPGSLAGDLPPTIAERSEQGEERPRWCIVMTGHNDAFHGIPADPILFQIAQCAYRAREAGMRVLVVGPIPVKDAPERNRGRQEEILAELDAKLAAFCTSSRVAFVSSRDGLAEVAAPPGGWLVPEAGNHLVDAGLERVADLCADAIRRAEATNRRKTLDPDLPSAR